MTGILKRVHCRAFGLVALTIGAGMAAPQGTRAAEVDLTENLYAAVYAEESCRGARFSQDQWREFVAHIEQTSSGEPGAGNLIAHLDDTKRRVIELNHRTNCFDGQMTQLRQAFARKVAPAIGM